MVLSLAKTGLFRNAQTTMPENLLDLEAHRGGLSSAWIDTNEECYSDAEEDCTSSTVSKYAYSIAVCRSARSHRNPHLTRASVFPRIAWVSNRRTESCFADGPWRGPRLHVICPVVLLNTGSPTDMVQRIPCAVRHPPLLRSTNTTGEAKCQ